MSIDTSREVEKARAWAADNPRTAHQIGLDVALACLDAMSARLSDAIVEGQRLIDVVLARTAERDQLRAEVELARVIIREQQELLAKRQSEPEDMQAMREQAQNLITRLNLTERDLQAERTAREQAEARGREWQPIETAPLGQDVIIGGGGCPYVHQNKLVKSGNIRRWRGLGDKQQPTLWMPLPDLPREAQS